MSTTTSEHWVYVLMVVLLGCAVVLAVLLVAAIVTMMVYAISDAIWGENDEEE